MTKSFRDLLSDAIKVGASPEDAYESAVSGVRKVDLASHFRPLGVEEARHMQRMSSRRMENRVFGGGGRRLESRDLPVEVVDVRVKLATLTWNSGGRTLNWLTATVEEHEERAAEQEHLAGRVLVDAERHRRAVKLIRDAGGATLEDVDDLRALSDEAEAA